MKTQLNGTFGSGSRHEKRNLTYYGDISKPTSLKVKDHQSGYILRTKHNKSGYTSHRNPYLCGRRPEI
jgi:hypothetical protein